MATIPRAEWEARRAAWQGALTEIGREIGEDSQLYRVLGSSAWGRYEGEPSPAETKDNVVFGAGFLAGVRYAAMNAGREFGLKGTGGLERIRDRLH